MAVRVRAVRKNHNPTLYIIELSPTGHLGKYKRDWN